MRILETIFLVWPMQYMRDTLLVDPGGSLGAFVMGLFLSYGLFMPLARIDALHAGVVCTVYVSSVAWCVGHIGTGMCVYAGLVWRMRATHYLPCLTTGCMRVRVLGDGAYVALALGMSFAFPVASMITPTPGMQPHTLREWCRPSPGLPAEFIYVPIFLMGWVTGLVDIPGVTTTDADVTDAPPVRRGERRPADYTPLPRSVGKRVHTEMDSGMAFASERVLEMGDDISLSSEEDEDVGQEERDPDTRTHAL
ncbi:MAG: hypothetical protein JKY23_05210 [Nitrospinaceae bacterium]|nr:hypothetical protein [Nitrospinaceae bacterium]